MDINLIDWKNMTTQEFIKLAQQEHGDAYDYSEVLYVSKSKKVDIVCPKHGVFHQAPTYHLSGHGCNHRECIQAKREKTMLSRHGAVNPMQTKVGMANFQKSCMDKYGVPFALSDSGVRDKIIDTMNERYGGNGAMCSEQVREKSKRTLVEKYGTDNVMKSDAVKKKQQSTLISNIGVSNPMLSSDVVMRQLESRRDTVLARYGVAECLASPEIRDKIIQTNLARYGVTNPMQNPDVIQKNFDVRQANGTLNTSRPEEWLYGRLCDVFGVDGVVRQYKDERYPYACDFYVVSRDMFVELNGCWSHGGHWFNSMDGSDVQFAECLRDKGKEQDFYRTAYDVWTKSDVEKRMAAKRSNLNYIVFWDGCLEKSHKRKVVASEDCLYDAELWFACGCPDGQDWLREYSWIPERKFDAPDFPRFSGTSTNLSRIAKFAHYGVFFRREIQLWKENSVHGGVALQIWLYYNRYKYLGKTPLQLSDFELLRGFTISGLLKGYTVFDTCLMDEVVKKYGVKSVYDPCAGWGERMLYCYKKGLEYYGADINSALEPGYERLVDLFGIHNQDVLLGGDSAVIALPESINVDAVITCPPYGNTEIYSEEGAENLGQTEFLAWWSNVVENSLRSNPEYFCLQINQKWRQSMADCIESRGYVLVDELVSNNQRVSHMNRKSDGTSIKKEYESMLVFYKI